MPSHGRTPPLSLPVVRAALVLAFAALLAGCATISPSAVTKAPATTLSVVGTPAPIDGRARFRHVFCSALATTDAPCETLLWRLPEEPTDAPSEQSSQPLSKRMQILIVGGAFGDCYPPATTAFVGAVEHLRQDGIEVDYVPVSGRSSAELNSETIAKRIASIAQDDTRALVLVGYSKGVADILESLTRHPEMAQRVAAVIGIAGAVNGSPLADRYEPLYRSLLSKRKLGACPTGDGGVLLSLDRSARLRWLAENPLPARIHYYSLGTFSTSDRTARALHHTQKQLARVDARNDGQLLAQDEIIPGSVLLGYANADHWSIAVQLEDRFPFLVHRAAGRHLFPQQALLDSILRLVQADLRLAASY
jgi:hypothetical protein